MIDIQELVAFAIKNKAAELHLQPDLPPQMMWQGELRRINVPPFTSAEIGEMLAPHVNPELLHEFRVGRDGTFRFELKGLGTITGRITKGAAVLEMPNRAALLQAQAAASSGTGQGTSQSRGMPGYMISLKLLGVVLLGVAGARFFGMELLPEAWRFANYAVVCFIVGAFLLMLRPSN